MSLVITIVDGGDTLRRMLQAVRAQQGAPALQGLRRTTTPGRTSAQWPQSSPRSSSSASAPCKPRLAASTNCSIDGELPVSSAPPVTSWPFSRTERRRARIWCAAMARLHRELPDAVIGGAIESAADDRLNWAFYACDFSRYALPFDGGRRERVLDVCNVCYKRRAIELTRDLWQERFHEPEVHWRIMQSGETLYLTPDAVVDYKTPYTSLVGVLPERFEWGRLFGYIRARNVSVVERLKFIAAGPILPFVLLRRHAAAQAARGQAARFWQAAPMMLPLLMAWSAGEVWGYITRRG